MPMKLLGRFCSRRRNSKARRNVYPIERWLREIKHRFHLGVQFAVVNAGHLQAEHRVGVVLYYDCDSINFLTRHRPQGLDGVHAATVALDKNDLAIRAGNRRSESHRESPADGAATDRAKMIMGACTFGRGEYLRTVGSSFVDQDRVVRHQRTKRLTYCLCR